MIICTVHDGRKTDGRGANTGRGQFLQQLFRLGTGSGEERGIVGLILRGTLPRSHRHGCKRRHQGAIGSRQCAANRLQRAPVDIMSVISGPLNGNVLCWQGGGACLALSALFTFEAHGADLLLGELPPLVHIRKEADRCVMRWYLERMMQVIREPQPGGVLLGEHLAQMMLIEVLRLHMAEETTSGVGWLPALTDKQMSAAITAIHEDPGYRWTLQTLAARVGMSRSAFALRFKEKVGSSAMDYLTRWRMRSAGHRLLNSDESVSSIALSLGYASESAFGFAFKREMGCSPRQYGVRVIV